MTTSLAELIAQRAEELSKEQPSRAELVHEWQDAVDKLFVQFRDWVRAADTEQFVKVDRTSVDRYERSLGSYRGDRLVVSLAGDAVAFETGDRMGGVSGFIDDDPAPQPLTGRVDVKYGDVVVDSLYRVGTGADSTWVIRRPTLDRDFRFSTLTRERFERILVDTLQ